MKKMRVKMAVAVLGISALFAGYSTVLAAETEEVTEAGVLEDGVYSAEFDTDSSMFHVNEAKEGRGILTVEEGKMTIHVSLVSKSIVNLFVGTAEDAQKEGTELLEPTIDQVTYSDGYTEDVYGFDIPVPALDEEFDLAIIGKKEKWYDRKILFRAESLPEEAVLVELPDYEELKRAAREKRIEEMKEEREGDKVPEEDQKASDDILPADGTYTLEVALEGGSGRASVQSPAIVTVTDQKAVLTVEWSSSHYDYMLVGEEKYLPVSTEGNAVGGGPAAVLDGSISVTADTTAMSTPHEIDYTLILSGDTLQRTEAEGSSRDSGRGSMLLGILALCVSASGIVKKKLG